MAEVCRLKALDRKRKFSWTGRLERRDTLFPITSKKYLESLGKNRNRGASGRSSLSTDI